MNLKHMDILFALIFICLFVGAFGVALKFPDPVLSGDPGAAFFPKMISIASLFFCVLLIINRIIQIRALEKDKKTNTIEAGLGPFFIIAGSVALLIVAIRYLGSEIAFFAFLFILLGLRTKRWVWSLFVSLISSAIIYIVFVGLLNVHLPVLFLPKYITF